MKILIVSNKYLSRGGIKRIDGSYWNVYIPLMKLGHEVSFFDTVYGENKNFEKTVEDFKPNIIFCCLTYDKVNVPNEPIEELKKITKEGNIKTFNWFCDDTWRFDSFSSKVCWDFTACSTPEPNCIEKYKQIGYKNILLGLWHTNSDLCQINNKKVYDVGFCGHMNNQRINILNIIRNLGMNINVFSNVSQEDMMYSYSISKVGINASLNENDVKKQPQMKLRMIEIPASKSLLLTEYTPGLEQLFDIDKEILTFKSTDEMIFKLRYVLNNDNIRDRIANASHIRFLKEHESKVRLKKLLEEINKI